MRASKLNKTNTEILIVNAYAAIKPTSSRFCPAEKIRAMWSGGELVLRRPRSRLIHLTVSISAGKNHQSSRLSLPSLSILALYLPPSLPSLSLPLSLSAQIYTDTHTHPCSTVAEHCNFSTAAVFACHKSDTPLALLPSLPPSIRPSIRAASTSRAAVFRRA